MPASRRVTRAVNEVLDLAPRRGEVSLARLVDSVAESRGRPIELKMADLPSGVCGQWRQYTDRDVFLIQQGLPRRRPDPGARAGPPRPRPRRHLRRRGGQGPHRIRQLRPHRLHAESEDRLHGPQQGEDLEQEAEDFAALLIYRLGRLPSDRASIVQVRLGEAFG